MNVQETIEALKDKIGSVPSTLLDDWAKFHDLLASIAKDETSYEYNTQLASFYRDEHQKRASQQPYEAPRLQNYGTLPSGRGRRSVLGGMMTALFTPDKEPRSGTPKMLWDWFVALELPNKAKGIKPEYLFHQTIGRSSDPSNASYTIVYQGKDYAIYNAKEAKFIVKHGFELEWGYDSNRYYFYPKGKS